MTTTEIKELFELTTQRVAKIETESAREIAQIRKEAEGIRKVAKILEEYFYRGLKSNVDIGDMTSNTIVRNEHIDGKEYDIILENKKAVMLVSVKTNISSNHIRRLINNDIVMLKNSSRYQSIYQ